MKAKVDQKGFSKHTLKIISLFFGTTLWFYVLNSAPVVTTQKIPLNFKLPKNMAISNVIEREVIVKLKGSRVFMRNIFQKKQFYTN